MPRVAVNRGSEGASIFARRGCGINAYRAGSSREGTATRAARSITMMDVIMLAIGLVFFALSVAYVYACEQL